MKFINMVDLLSGIKARLSIKNRTNSHLDWSGFSPEGFLQYLQNQPVRRFVFQNIKKYFHSHRFSKILEVGFGSADQYAIMKEFFIENSIEYTGVDYTEKFVQNAMRKYPEAGWQKGDVRKLKFPDEFFDVVIIFHVLEHQKGYKDVKKAIGELCRVSRRRVMIVWFRRPTFSHETKGGLGKDGFYYYKYNISDIWKAVESTNFKVAQITSGQNSVWDLESKDHNKFENMQVEKIICKRIEEDYSMKEFLNILAIGFGSLELYANLKNLCMEKSLNYNGLCGSDDFIKTASEKFPHAKWRQGNILNVDDIYDWIVYYVKEDIQKPDEIKKIISALSRLSKRRIVFVFDYTISFLGEQNRNNKESSFCKFSASYIWNEVISMYFETKQITFAEKLIWEIEKKEYSDYILKNQLF